MKRKDLLTFVIVGHVDHGKSTLAGRLLADTDSIPSESLSRARSDCEKLGRPFEYSFLLDTLKDERSRGITIDTTRVFLRTARRDYMIFDAPGHVEFLKNMVSGAAKADAAILVVDAKTGIQENSKRHGLLLSVLGVRQVSVLINKMDLVSYSSRVYENLKTDFGRYLDQLGVTPTSFIPVAAAHGENIATPSKNMSWYTGPTVLDQLDRFESSPSLETLSLRIPVQDVYRFSDDPNNKDRQIVVGPVESGTLRRGDRIVFFPSGEKAVVASLESFPKAAPKKYSAEESAAFFPAASTAAKRGEIACQESEPAPRVSSRIDARIFWLGSRSMEIGSKYVLKLGTARCEATLREINRVVEPETLNSGSWSSIGSNQVADVIFDLDRPIAYETQESHPTLSRFVLQDGLDVAGGGVARSVR